MIDLHVSLVERIETNFDALTSQMRRSFKELAVQQERGVAAHQAVHAMKEQAAQVGGGRQLPDLFDIPLPAQQRRGLERAVLMTMIDGIEPMPKALVQLLQR